MFRDSMGRIGRHAYDAETVFSAGIQVDVVESCTTQGDQFDTDRCQRLGDGLAESSRRRQRSVGLQSGNRTLIWGYGAKNSVLETTN